MLVVIRLPDKRCDGFQKQDGVYQVRFSAVFGVSERLVIYVIYIRPPFDLEGSDSLGPLDSW